jgi:hypothetical protein
MDQLFEKIDVIGDSLSALTRDAASLARTRADTAIDDLADEFSAHPLRSLLIAVGIGVTAGLYIRK